VRSENRAQVVEKRPRLDKVPAGSTAFIQRESAEKLAVPFYAEDSKASTGRAAERIKIERKSVRTALR
jgi:hypothetical protein